MKLTVLAAFFVVLSVSVANAAEPVVTPPDPTAGARTFPVLRVEITDADVAPVLVAPMTDAMTDPKDRIRRLHLLLQVAKKTNHTFILTHGVRTFVVPRAENGFLPLDGDALSAPLRTQTALNIPRASSLFPAAGTHADQARYRLHQVVHLAGRINTDGTATVQYELVEVPKSMPGMVPVGGARGLTVEVTDTQDFHSGDTIAVPIRAYGLGVQHRVFITVTIVPPNTTGVADNTPSEAIVNAAPPPVRKKPAAKPLFIVHLGSGEARTDGNNVFIALKDPDTSIVKMEITNADVSSDLIGAVTEAMSDPVNQKSRLRSLSEDAIAHGETCVITRHARAFANPRAVPIKRAAWSVPVSDSLYTYPGKTKGPATVRRRLTLALTPRLKPNGTVTVRYDVWNRQTAVVPIDFLHSAPATVWGQGNLLSFRSGETKAIAIHYPADDVQHLVFATVTVQKQAKK